MRNLAFKPVIAALLLYVGGAFVAAISMDRVVRTITPKDASALGFILFNSDVVSRRLRELCPVVTVRIIPDVGHALVDPTELVHGFLSDAACS